MVKETQDILTLENKEKFRRKLLISSRIIGVLLILAIFWIGFIQIKYVAKINAIKTEYGEGAYCYLCGLENGRSCSCNYISDMDARNPDFDSENYLENIAIGNVAPCENMNKNSWDLPGEFNLIE